MRREEPDFIFIEEWSLIYDKHNSVRLHGKVQNHPQFGQNIEVTTSKILSVNKEEQYVETESGRKYKLGKVDEKYEKQFPDAFDRVYSL